MAAHNRTTAVVNTVMDEVLDVLSEISQGHDDLWLTSPKTVRRQGNPVADLGAARPALFVRVTGLSECNPGITGTGDCKLTFQVACLGPLQAEADHDVWDLEADVRRALQLDVTLGGLIKGGLFWTGSEVEVLAGAGGSNESIAVATFAGTVFWGTDSP